MNKRIRKKKIKQKLYDAYNSTPKYGAIVLCPQYMITADSASFDWDRLYKNDTVFDCEVLAHLHISKVICLGGKDNGRRN